MPYKSLCAFRRAYRSAEGTLAYAKTHYIRRDMREYEEFKEVLGAERAPQSLAKLQSLKYNKNSLEYALFKREKITISKIKGKEWSTTFKQKAIDTYYEFRENGIELTDHGVARLLSRFADKKAEIKWICNNKPFNYLQADGRRVKFYDKIAVVYLKDADEVVSVIGRPTAKEEWIEIDNTDNV